MPLNDTAANTEKHKYPGNSVYKNSEFFILIGKKDFHTFVMLGVMEQGIPFYLVRVGKSDYIDPSSDSLCTRLFKIACTHRVSELQSEGLWISDTASYTAYSITYKLYLQFLHLLGLINANPEQHTAISSYQPFLAELDSDEADAVMLEYNQFKKGKPNNITEKEQTIIDRTHNLNLSNTCRHTGLDLIEYTFGDKTIVDKLSSSFLHDFPLTKANEHLYILPLPPSAFEHDDKKLARLAKIYRQMEKLLTIDPYSQVTIDKFEALKQLYNKQAGIPHGNISDALTCISEWKTQNKNLINQFRGYNFFARLFLSKPATAAMADEIEQALIKEQVQLSKA